jgi:transcriptional regulator of acetoin/glycerol metabolism
LAALKSHSWPGNIRQLENVIERAVVVAEGPTITVEDLPQEVAQSISEQVEFTPTTGKDATAFKFAPAVGLRAEREERGRRERERLVRALAAADGNKAEAARALGLARSTLLSRLKKHGLS